MSGGIAPASAIEILLLSLFTASPKGLRGDFFRLVTTVLEQGDERRNRPGICDRNLVVDVPGEKQKDLRGDFFRHDGAILEQGDERWNRPGIFDRDLVVVVF